MVIRRATPEDADPLAAFAEQTFRDTFGADNDPRDMDAYCASAFSLEAQRSHILDPNMDVFILHDDGGALAGYAQLRWATVPPTEVVLRPTVELARIYLDEAFHGKGIAAVLVSHLLAAAKLRGSRSAWLTVWQEAPQAIRFWRKHGFQSVGRSIFYIGDDPKEDWVMTQALPEG